MVVASVAVGLDVKAVWSVRVLYLVSMVMEDLVAAVVVVVVGKQEDRDSYGL